MIRTSAIALLVLVVCPLAARADQPAASRSTPAAAPAVVAPPPAPAQLTGGKAKPLLRALKFAGVKATKTKEKGGDKWVYRTTTVGCHTASENDDTLGMYDCQIDKLSIADAKAVLLNDALEAAGFPSDAQMSQTHVHANGLVCTDDQSAAGGADAMYVCTFAK